MRPGFLQLRLILQVNEQNNLSPNFYYDFKRENFLFFFTFNFLDLETTSADHETRLTAAEENIQGNSPDSVDNWLSNFLYRVSSERKSLRRQNLHNITSSFHFLFLCLTLSIIFPGLQAADVSLDARVTALEESGGGSSGNG